MARFYSIRAEPPFNLQLCMGHPLDQLVLLQPGVFLARLNAIGGDQSIPGFAQSTMWFSAAGSRPSQSITLLDGTSINSLFYRAGSGVGGRNLGVDAIREFRLCC